MPANKKSAREEEIDRVFDRTLEKATDRMTKDKTRIERIDAMLEQAADLEKDIEKLYRKVDGLPPFQKTMVLTAEVEAHHTQHHVDLFDLRTTLDKAEWIDTEGLIKGVNICPWCFGQYPTHKINCAYLQAAATIRDHIGEAPVVAILFFDGDPYELIQDPAGYYLSNKRMIKIIELQSTKRQDAIDEAVKNGFTHNPT
jgi:hypothetical protein